MRINFILVHSGLTFWKSAHQKLKKFLYTFIHFFSSVKDIAKNNFAVPHIQRDSRCRACLIFGKIASAHIGDFAVFQHSFHNIITVGQHGNIKVFPLKSLLIYRSDIKKFILIILYEPYFLRHDRPGESKHDQ